MEENKRQFEEQVESKLNLIEALCRKIKTLLEEK